MTEQTATKTAPPPRKRGRSRTDRATTQAAKDKAPAKTQTKATPAQTAKTDPKAKADPKPAAEKPKAVKAEAKRELATKVVEAAAGIDGLTDEQRVIVAHWLHHLPADRDRWVAAGLPRPDRSDWR